MSVVVLIIYSWLYVSVITQARGLCLIYTHNVRGRTVLEGECVYIRQAGVPVL